MLATLTVVFVIGILFMLFLLIGGVFYSRKGWNKKFFHDVMGWHKPDNFRFSDGCSEHSYCRFCHKEIMQDSQGNWFTFD